MAKIIGNTTATPLMVDDKLSLDSKNPIQNKAVARALGKKIELKGDAEENSLPTENNVKGDVYRLYEKDNISTTEKYLASGKYIYNELVLGDETHGGYGFNSVYWLLLSDENRHDFDSNNPLPVNIYDVGFVKIGIGELYYAGEMDLWTFKTSTASLTPDEVYYIERADGETPDDLESTTIEEFEKIIKGYAIYNGESFDKIYTARGLENIIKEITNSSLNFKGNIKEDKLPADGNVLGDVYKIFTDVPAEKQYIQVYIRHDENTQCYYGSSISDTETYLYTSEEYDQLVENNYFDVNIDCDVYDADWNYIYTGIMSYKADCGGWCIGEDLADGMQLGNTYYIVRFDNLIPMDISLSAHNVLDIEYTGYAIYNGKSFDKLYNKEVVDSKIAEVEEYFNNKIADAKQWKTLIDTTLTEEQGGVSVLKIEIPDYELLKKATKMRVLVDIQSGEDGIASQTLALTITDYNSGSYSCYLGWSTGKCDANKKLMYRGITEFFPVQNNAQKTKNTLTFYSAPTIYEDANACGNATKLPSVLNTHSFEKYPPYLKIALKSDGLMQGGTRVLMEVFE